MALVLVGLVLGNLLLRECFLIRTCVEWFTMRSLIDVDDGPFALLPLLCFIPTHLSWQIKRLGWQELEVILTPWTAKLIITTALILQLCPSRSRLGGPASLLSTTVLLRDLFEVDLGNFLSDVQTVVEVAVVALNVHILAISCDYLANHGWPLIHLGNLSER